MKEHFKKATVWTLAAGLVTLVAGVSLFVLGPQIETKILPVINNVQATPITIDTERQVVHIAAFGHKARQCEWKGITAMVFKEGKWHQGSVYFTDPRIASTTGVEPQQSLPVSRPVGPQSLGQIYVFPVGEKVQVHLYHQCHPLWQSHTFLYELDFNQKPHQTR